MSYAQREGLAPDELTRRMLSEVARESLGLHVELSEDAFKRALDPQAFVDARLLPGGAAPSATADVLAREGESFEDDRRTLAESSARINRCARLSKQLQGRGRRTPGLSGVGYGDCPQSGVAFYRQSAAASAGSGSLISDRPSRVIK